MSTRDPADSSTTTHPPSSRRRVLPAVFASLALVVAGTGLGYVVGRQLRSPAAGTPATSSNPLFFRGNRSWGYGDGGWPGGPDGDGTPPWSAPGSQGQVSTPSAGTKATASQLVGLVRIVATMKYADGKAAGTGMLLSADGEVVTNHHVVEGATSVEATVMSTGRTYTARLVGSDAAEDVAVLQLVGASGLATVIPDTSPVSVGDEVTAVGDGNGSVSYLSAATGTVLARNQSITTQSEGTASGERLTGLFEISSDVVGGYSGGATYDADGQVAGMTTAASSGADVVGYAIPMATVVRIAGALQSHAPGAAYRYGYPAFLGVGLGQDGTVQEVYDGTPAARAGLTAGARVTRVGGTSTPTTDRLQAAIAGHRPGDRVAIRWRDAAGTTHLATVTLATGPVE